MYKTWPKTLTEDPMVMMNQCEGIITVLQRDIYSAAGLSYTAWQDGELVGKIDVPSQVTDFILRHQYLFCYCHEDNVIVIADLKWGFVDTIDIKPYIPVAASASFGFYGGDVALFITETTKYYALLIHGKSAYNWNLKEIETPAGILPRNPHEYILGATAAPYQFGCFYIASPYRLRFYTVTGPYYMFAPVADDPHQPPFVQRLNLQRQIKEHLSYTGWDLITRIENAELSLKFASVFNVQRPTSPWINLYVDGSLVNPLALFPISPDPTIPHTLRLEALRTLTDVDITCMTPFNMRIKAFDSLSITRIPWMKPGDIKEYTIQAVTPVPGRTDARVMSMLNVRVRAEVW